MKIYGLRFEYTLYRFGEEQILDDSSKVLEYLEGIFDDAPAQERTVVIPVDRKLRPVGRMVVSTGTRKSCLMDAAEIFRPVIVACADGFFLAHNHPSGDPAPSKADTSITLSILSASKVVGLRFVDHIIVGDKRDDPKGTGYYSYGEEGIIHA